MDRLLPPRLKKGDVIQVVTPASPVDLDRLKRGVRFLNELGFRVRLGRVVRRLFGGSMISAPDDERRMELEEAFADRSVKCVIASRGGYGTLRLLASLDYALIRENPKITVGYSDLTALINTINTMTGLVTFHGPMVAVDFGSDKPSAYTLEWFQKATMGEKPIGVVEQPNGYLRCVVEGSGKGLIVGGNLSLLTSLLGTPYEPNFEGKIVLIEEVDEDPYKVDGMLTHLILNGSIKKASGIVFSKCVNCPPPERAGKTINAVSVEEVVCERLKQIGVPSVYGFNAGHLPDIPTLPIGVEGELNASEGLFSVTEVCTS
ncbi:MAG: LD-carboxypeptidase [Thermoprotei archaeon]